MSQKKTQFGTEPLGKLLRQQAIPASVGMLVMSIYGIVDTIFVGQYVGSLGIGAITVVLPITFLISSIGMAIGVGGASIISRAFGRDDDRTAHRTFGSQMMTALTLSIFFVLMGFLFIDEILQLFGGKGDILPFARDYFQIILYGIPFLAWAMMSNNVIRAEGFPRTAMFTLLVPAVTNLILDPIFIIWLDMGIEGAAWATTLSYMSSAVYTAWFFIFGKSGMKLNWDALKLHPAILKEMASLGSVTLSRQGTISVLYIVLNNTLFAYGGEMAIAVYGVISRVMMFANFPVLGVTQGFTPIVGYNFGAYLHQRVEKITRLAIKSATFISLGIFAGVMIFADQLVLVFSSDPKLIDMTAPAMRIAFLATPLIALNMIGSAFFQAAGNAKKALVLSLSKQGFLLIPLVFLLPLAFGLDGVWMAFPLADVGAAAISFYFLRRANVRIVRKREKPVEISVE